MKHYYFNLLDSEYNDLGCLIPDGNNVSVAVNYAKGFMREHNINYAQLEDNSMITSNLLRLIDVEL